MCQASRSPHTATRANSRIRRNEVTRAQNRRDGADTDESEAPRDVDDVVPADASADGEGDAVQDHQHGDRRGGDERGSSSSASRRANVHW